MKKRILVLIMFISACSQSLADTESNINLDVAISHDDNLNISPDDEFAIDSLFASVGASYNLNKKINYKSFFDSHLTLKYENYQDTDGLNNTEFSAGIGYNIKPGAGFTKATYILKGDIRVNDYETDIRDRTVYEATGIMSFWVTNTISMRTGLTARMRDSDSTVFDTKDFRLFINADLILNRKSTLYSTLNLLTGDLTSTIDQDDENEEILDLINQADAIEFDPTFGDNMIAYKVNTDIAALTLGYNYVFSRKQSLDFSARYAIGKADFNVDYNATFINFSYLVSFGL